MDLTLFRIKNYHYVEEKPSSQNDKKTGVLQIHISTPLNKKTELVYI